MIISSATVARRDGEAATPSTRRLAVTWQHPGRRLIQPIGILSFDGQRYGFHYLEDVKNVDGFRPLLGFADLRDTYTSTRLFPLFSQRVMDPARPDYQRYVTRLGLNADATPWEQISRSEGRREGDTLQLFPEPIVNPSGLMECAFLVHGVRHIIGRHLSGAIVHRNDLKQVLADIGSGSSLLLEEEPDNPVNARALLTTTESGFPLGWLPDLLVDDVRSQDFSRARVTVDRVNGPEALWHLRILARLAVPVPPGHIPFSSSSWRPYSGGPSPRSQYEKTSG
ncbi:hypothetical protein [Pseudofrankia sp. DC12]|uniref:hypothetical protein n=1 Tax=Pseudofrankia sp. DC12 TaxID=683315 RepID=UPI000B09FA52|nr:hypothetical protein [Pseudofrankia sp. DC12]